MKPTPDAPDAPDPWRGVRVLLVDDDAVNRILASRVVAIVTGLEPDIARDGEEAVSLASEMAYDLILMDLQMPGMDGLQAALHIRSWPSPAGQVAIVALTASAWDTDLERCRSAGMNGLLAKPLTAADLRALPAPAGRSAGRH